MANFPEYSTHLYVVVSASNVMNFNLSTLTWLNMMVAYVYCLTYLYT